MMGHQSGSQDKLFTPLILKPTFLLTICYAALINSSIYLTFVSTSPSFTVTRADPRLILS